MAKARNPVVDARVFRNVFICMKCNAKIRTNNPKKTKCRKCGAKALRPKKKHVKITTA